MARRADTPTFCKVFSIKGYSEPTRSANGATLLSLRKSPLQATKKAGPHEETRPMRTRGTTPKRSCA